MKRKYLKKCLCLGLVGALAVGTTGCKQMDMALVTDLTEEQEDLLVEYVANAVLNYDKNYIDRMRFVAYEKETEAETEEPTSQSQQTSPEKPTGGNESQKPSVSVPETPSMTMDEIFGIPGVHIQPSGYEVVDAYPSNGEELGMSMIAIKGCKLLVVKFKVTGNGSQIDLLKSGAVYKGIINDSVKVNAQVTALLDGFNTFQGVIEKGKTEELVLVFQVDENDTKNVRSVDLNIIYNDKQGNVTIAGQ